MNVAIVTLGCSKNQVDSEMIIGVFKNNNFTVVDELDIADVIIVNTCGFIESAKKEAISVILDMIDYKSNGNCKSLIVTGCLAKRYKQDIIDNFPEVDLVIGNDEYDHIKDILTDYFKLNICCGLNFKDRIISTKFPSAYIRISDGCDNKCSYCAIPLIRGRFKSRYKEDILEEVKLLASQGIEEFNIISQDTTKYGMDIYNKYALAELLHEISLIDGVKWIRILYMYAFEITDELLDEIKNNDKICKYFDIPIQHLNNRLLKLMNRYDTKEVIFERVKKIRNYIPEAILRTTVIVGFPTETDEEFNELVEGIKLLKFDKLGAFTYSREEDTISYDLDGQIDENIKVDRYNKLMETQKDVSRENIKKYINKEYEALVEDVSDDNEYFVLRTYMDAPDVDGRVLVKLDDDSISKIIIGEFVKIRIIDTDDYDFYAEVVERN